MQKKEFSDKLDLVIKQFAEAVAKFPVTKLNIAARTETYAELHVNSMVKPSQVIYVWLDKTGEPQWGWP